MNEKCSDSKKTLKLPFGKPQSQPHANRQHHHLLHHHNGRSAVQRKHIENQTIVFSTMEHWMDSLCRNTQQLMYSSRLAGLLPGPARSSRHRHMKLLGLISSLQASTMRKKEVNQQPGDMAMPCSQAATPTHTKVGK